VFPVPDGPLYIDGDAYRLSLSGLLNALDGVGAQEGRILFATTNKYSALDAALCRPGRMDLHVEFKNASKYQARELFSRFYLPTETCAIEDDVEEKESVTDSGYESSSENSDIKPTQSEVSTEKVKEQLSPTSDLPFTGTSHTGRAPKLSRVRIAKLAERFADDIPERECSMASLQGYLMAYKTRPVEAADEAGAWIESERAAVIAKASEKDKERTEKELKAKAEKEKAEKAAKEKEKAEKVVKEAEEANKPMLSTDKTPEASLPSPVSPTMNSTVRND
jgi:mitochondrial chaperone BCS1